MQNYTGSATAIAALIVSILTRFFPSINIETNDIVSIILGLITLGGIIKQMIDHQKQSNILAEVTAKKPE